jgi:hypothetical protein
MAWFALILVVVAFGAVALAFGWSERAEERRILERAEAILARGSIAVDLPAPAGTEPGAAVARRGAPGCVPDAGGEPVAATPFHPVRSAA